MVFEVESLCRRFDPKLITTGLEHTTYKDMAIFSKKEKVSLDLQAISTLISEGSVLDGNLKAPAFARIDGLVNGNVSIDEGLILGEKGEVKGNIHTKEIVIYGAVNGDITTTSLEIRATGKITGNIKTQNLTVENGGVYNGNLTMQQGEKQKQLEA